MAVLSSMSSHSRPTDGIWTKWSITEIEENPTSSAARAITPSRAAVSSGAPGQVNRPICNPKRRAIGSSSWRRANVGDSKSCRGTVTTGSSEARWTSSKPSWPSSSRTTVVAANERSWPDSTAEGTASGRPRFRARHSRSGVSTATA